MELMDNIDPLTDRRIKSMCQKANTAKKADRNADILDIIKLIRENRLREKSKGLFS